MRFPMYYTELDRMGSLRTYWDNPPGDCWYWHHDSGPSVHQKSNNPFILFWFFLSIFSCFHSLFPPKLPLLHCYTRTYPYIRISEGRKGSRQNNESFRDPKRRKEKASKIHMNKRTGLAWKETKLQNLFHRVLYLVSGVPNAWLDINNAFDTVRAILTSVRINFKALHICTLSTVWQIKPFDRATLGSRHVELWAKTKMWEGD